MVEVTGDSRFVSVGEKSIPSWIMCGHTGNITPPPPSPLLPYASLAANRHNCLFLVANFAKNERNQKFTRLELEPIFLSYSILHFELTRSPMASKTFNIMRY